MQFNRQVILFGAFQSNTNFIHIVVVHARGLDGPTYWTPTLHIQSYNNGGSIYQDLSSPQVHVN
jgi:hypothetical protein